VKDKGETLEDFGKFGLLIVITFGSEDETNRAPFDLAEA
jgi:hypothetical protein